MGSVKAGENTIQARHWHLYRNRACRKHRQQGPAFLCPHREYGKSGFQNSGTDKGPTVGYTGE